MYGTEQYGTTQYANDSNNLNPSITQNYKDKLLSNLPQCYRQDAWLNDLYKAAGEDLGTLDYIITDLNNQINPSTATWGLNIWENELNIITDLNKTYEERREVVKAKLCGQGTTTKKMIQNTAVAFSGGDVNIIEHPESYSFTVQFVGIRGIPKNMQSFINMLEDIKPAHLAYSFKYTYTVWNFLKEKNLTWDSAKSKTCDDLKVYE
jgi:uncharacterized protein YmfQ (DUF2313 family)